VSEEHACLSLSEPDTLVVDRAALLVALVLVPHSYPRNKFYEMFRDPEAWQARRRAARLRSIIADLVAHADDIELERTEGDATLRYRLPEMGATRICRLNDTELALVKLATERVRPRPELRVDGDVEAHVSGLVARLMPSPH
jgi:hypothetical protein